MASTAALTMVGSLVLAAAAGADPADHVPLATRPNNAAPPARNETESPVSTSPGALARLRATPTEQLAGDDPNDLPLTRAAAQQRIEAMSPVTWLSSFGSVNVGRPE